MSFTGNIVCTSFKAELLKAGHDFTASTGHTFKLALYDSDASLTAATTDYSATNELSGGGYTAGGYTLTCITPTTDGLRGIADFDDLAISITTSSARGALIYNTTYKGGSGTTNAVMVLDFGRDRSDTGGVLTITFPSPDALNAILRI